jgi:N-acetylmuramoyl-L-alanine amidase
VTEAAVRLFQRTHGLREHGVCDEATWLALVEASWRLGDRPLRLVAPNMRGDDVATLQARLGRLGFDCGRVDGIFGTLTARALEDFQRNCGLDVDGVFGPTTARALEVNSAHTGSGPGIAALRELESLGHVSASLRDLRVVIGQFGGMSSLVRTVVRDLRGLGANVVSVDELDPSLQAAAANRHAATAYLGFEAEAGPQGVVSYYSTRGFHSAGGRTLALQLVETLGATGVLAAVEAAGMRLPVLRETRMTAVVCTLGPIQRITDATGVVAEAVVSALAAWALSPVLMTGASADA